MLTNYLRKKEKSFQRSKQFLRTTTRHIISRNDISDNSLLETHSKQYLQTIIKQLTANCAYISLSENSVHSKENFLFIAHLLQTILLKLWSENSLQTMLSGLAGALQQIKPRVTLLTKTQNLVLIVNNYSKLCKYGKHMNLCLRITGSMWEACNSKL